MAFDSSTVSVGEATKKAHFDQLLSNTLINYRLADSATSKAESVSGSVLLQKQYIVASGETVAVGDAIEINPDGTVQRWYVPDNLETWGSKWHGADFPTYTDGLIARLNKNTFAVLEHERLYVNFFMRTNGRAERNSRNTISGIAGTGYQNGEIVPASASSFIFRHDNNQDQAVVVCKPKHGTIETSTITNLEATSNHIYNTTWQLSTGSFLTNYYTANKIKAKIFHISGTNVLTDASATTNIGNALIQLHSVMLDSSTVFIGWQHSTNYRRSGLILEISGTALNFGSPYTVFDNTSSQKTTYPQGMAAIDANHLLWAYKYDTPAASGPGQVLLVTRSGTFLSGTTALVLNTPALTATTLENMRIYKMSNRHYIINGYDSGVDRTAFWLITYSSDNIYLSDTLDLPADRSGTLQLDQFGQGELFANPTSTVQPYVYRPWAKTRHNVIGLAKTAASGGVSCTVALNGGTITETGSFADGQLYGMDLEGKLITREHFRSWEPTRPNCLDNIVGIGIDNNTVKVRLELEE